jgi:hypothetical protein
MADVEAEISGTEEQKSDSETEWEDDWALKSRTGLEARSGQNAAGYFPIEKLPDFLRTPVECFTPRHWQFGLHNRDPRASSSETKVLKRSVAAACKLNSDEWDNFCADVVDNLADVVQQSYGICRVTKPNRKEVRYLLTLDALTLVLVLCSLSIAPDSVPDQPPVFWLPYAFIKSLVAGDLKILAFLGNSEFYSAVLDDLLLCENQIPMPLVKNAISKCYKSLPEERKFNRSPDLRELGNPDSCVTKQFLNKILKFGTSVGCRRIFADPFPDHLHNLINDNYEVFKLDNCADIFACIYEVMTSCVESPATIGTPSIAVTTTFRHAKQLLLHAVATIFRFSRKTASGEDLERPSLPSSATGEHFERPSLPSAATGVDFKRPSLPSATGLKKAGLKIKGIPGMVRQVVFENSCLSLPIMSHSEKLQSYMYNMLAYEYVHHLPPFFKDYLLLMSQLIKTPEDVSHLIACGVIRPYDGTEQLILQMWGSFHINYPRYSIEYKHKIVYPINRHCASTLNVLVTDFYNTYCSKPWLVISAVSAIVVIVAMLIQTYVLVISSDKMQPHFPRGG